MQLPQTSRRQILLVRVCCFWEVQSVVLGVQSVVFGVLSVVLAGAVCCLLSTVLSTVYSVDCCGPIPRRGAARQTVHVASKRP